MKNMPINKIKKMVGIRLKSRVRLTKLTIEDQQIIADALLSMPLSPKDPEERVWLTSVNAYEIVEMCICVMLDHFDVKRKP